MKTCSKCDIKKELTQFYKDKARSDGVEPSCKSCKQKEKKDFYKINSEKIIKSSSKYAECNKEKVKLYRDTFSKIYRKNNAEKCRYWAAKYRADKIQATPKWLSQEHLKEIENLYKQSKKLEILDNVERHVDHIVPLRGKNVCGLHVPWNLQILTKTENLRKKNNMEVVDVEEMGETPQ